MSEAEHDGASASRLAREQTRHSAVAAMAALYEPPAGDSSFLDIVEAHAIRQAIETQIGWLACIEREGDGFVVMAGRKVGDRAVGIDRDVLRVMHAINQAAVKVSELSSESGVGGKA